jgi:hypothetical protein
MVIWKLSLAYEYLGSGAYLIRHNFNGICLYIRIIGILFVKNKKYLL